MAVPPSASSAAVRHPFCAGGGATGDLIVAHDWSRTPLGPIDDWPHHLRSSTALMLRSPVPIAMLWGADGVMIYNDAYSVFAAGRHPALLGSKVREGWPEVADFNDHVMRVGLAGRTLAYRDQELTLHRNGAGERVWMNLDYSPLLDEHGEPAGVMAIVIETTARVRAERQRAAAEQALGAERDRYRAVLDGMAEGYALLDREFRILDVNAEALRLEARPREQLIGRTHWDAYPGSFDTELGALYREALRERVPVTLEHRYVWADGHAAWLEMRAYPVADGLAIFFRDITSRKTDERSLRASEARLALSVESLELATDAAEIGIWDLDLTTGILTWSDRTRAMFGMAPGAPCSMEDFYAGLHPDDRDATGAAFDAAIDPARRAIYDVEYRTIGKEDGVIRSVAAKGKALFDAGGRGMRAIGTVIDVTERRRAEARRRALATLGEAIRDLDDPAALGFAAAEVLGDALGLEHGGYGAFDEDAETVRIERGWHAPGAPEIAGRRPLRECGSYVDDLKAGRNVVIADVRLDPRTAAQAATLEALGVRALVNLPIAEGGRTVAVLYLTDAKPRAWHDAELAFAREVAERLGVAIARRNAERELRRLNASLERQVAERTAELDRVWANARDLHVVLDTGGILRAVNPAWSALLGHDPKDTIGRPFRDFLWPDDDERSRDGFPIASGQAPLDDFETRHRHLDGSPRWISWRTATEDALIYAYGRDVTAEREQASALAAVQNALRQAQKMEAVGQLTGGIAHDFNNMLAVIIGSLDLLRRRIGTADARAGRYLEAAVDGARRAAQLTQRLLAFSRQQPLNPEPIDANALIAGMSDLLRRSLGSLVRIETVLAGGLWRTCADPNQLESTLLNLAVNARDAMPGGGRLTIETQNAHLDARYTGEHLGVQPGQYVLIAVTDTGSGMDEEVIAKAFDPFFTTKPVGKGTGLGLSQVYGFVKQSGGHVKIYSEPGQGTTVKVYLPRLAAAAAEVPGTAADAHMPRGEPQEVVLVVEDQFAVRQITVEALTELGYRVLEADGAEAALRLLDAHPDIALLFTDVVMPDVNGARLAEEAQRRRPALRVLFTTGYTRNAVVHNGVLDPGVNLIVKPFSLDELATRVREVLEAP